MSPFKFDSQALEFKPLKDVAHVIMGQSPPSSAYNDERSGLPFFQGKTEFGSLHPTPRKWCSMPTKIAEPEDILMSIRAPVGPTNIAIERACIGRGLAAIRPKDGLRVRWLLYAFRAMESKIDSLGTGTTFKAISGDVLRHLEVPIAPLAYQDQAIEELEKQFSRLDEAVANLQRVKANLKRYKASVLKAAVEGRLVETEGGWRKSTLGEEGSIIGGLTKNQKRNDLPLKLPYLRVANVYANELRLDEIEYIGVAERELEKLLVRKGDLLLVEGNGSPDQIGRVALWNDAIPNCVHQNHLIKARFGGAVFPEWALIWMLSPVGRHGIERVSASTSGLHTLSVGKVSRLPIGVPSLKEQVSIVAEVDRHLSIIREVETEVDTNLHRAQAMRQSTLHRAFTET